ncbi:MAG: hypothetical protein Q9182_007541, partial [Xanthomendoza sp. 2 TL-2023]
RVSTHGFIHSIPQASKHRDTISSHQKPVPPEDVLFRRRHAPERYEEDDFYFANEDLTEGKELPDSDMLKAVHTYSSDFYGRALPKKAVVDFGSMDETALMCMGLLLEEYVQSILGETGDLVFVETGEEKEDGAAIRGAEHERRKGLKEKEKEKESIEMEGAVERGGEDEEASVITSETEGEDESSSSETVESDRRGKLSANRKDKGSQETEEAFESTSRDEESSENIEYRDQDQNSSSSESLSPELVRARKKRRVAEKEDDGSN